jgi:hypothetical protein
MGSRPFGKPSAKLTAKAPEAEAQQNEARQLDFLTPGVSSCLTPLLPGNEASVDPYQGRAHPPDWGAERLQSRGRDCAPPRDQPGFRVPRVQDARAEAEGGPILRVIENAANAAYYHRGTW